MDAVEHDAVASGQRKAASFADKFELLRTHPLGTERQTVRALWPPLCRRVWRLTDRGLTRATQNIERLLPEALKLYEASQKKASSARSAS